MANTMSFFRIGLLVLTGVPSAIYGAVFILPYDVVAADSFWRHDGLAIFGGLFAITALSGGRLFGR